MNISQVISNLIHGLILALGGFLMLHGTMPQPVAAMLAQIAAGVLLVAIAAGFHSLRVWIDAKAPTLAPLVDQVDAALGQTATATTTVTVGPTQATASPTTLPPAPLSPAVIQQIAVPITDPAPTVSVTVPKSPYARLTGAGT